jgi:hypothetical protein
MHSTKSRLVALMLLVGLSTAAIAAKTCSSCSCVKVKGTMLCACEACK